MRRDCRYASFQEHHPDDLPQICVESKVDVVELGMELVEGVMMDFHIQERFVIAQSWWLATELVRRNTQLRILEWHPGGGQYDALGLLDETRGKVIVSLNRRGGRIHVEESHDFSPVEWSEVFASKPALHGSW